MKFKYIYISIIGLIVLNCSLKEDFNNVVVTETPIIISDPLEYSEAVFITTDNFDNPVLAWSSAKNDSASFSLHYRRVNSATASLEAIKKIYKTSGMQAHHESMAKIGFKKNGAILTVYRRENTVSKRRFAGDLFFLESLDNGKTWGEENKLVTDTTSYSQSFYDLARLKNGEIGITWLDSRRLEQKEGSSIFFNQTNSDGGFIKEVGVLGSTCQCCRTELQVDKYGKINIAFRDIINDSIRDIMYVYSEDNGVTFSKGKRISDDNWMIKGCPHTGPTIATNNEQRATAWFTMGGGKGVYFTTGSISDETSPPRKLIDKNATHPQMIWAEGHFYLTYELRSNYNGKVYRQIVVSILDKTGKVLSTDNVSDLGVDSQMPVISQVNNKLLLIAWVDQNKEHSSIILGKTINVY